MSTFNMAANGNAAITRKRRDNESAYQVDDFSPATFDLSTKKFKMDQITENKPSRVIHIRNLPQEIDDAAVTNLAVPFGYIDNVVFVRKNNQALIQMKELSEAVEMAKYFTKYVPLVYGRHLFIQFSKHAQLDLHNANATLDKSVDQANEKRNQYIQNWTENTTGANQILRILIENAPSLVINHLVFHKIFSRFGEIVRIVSFTKTNQHHGLVEFDAPLGAHVAQLQLNGTHLLGEHGGLMRVDFSKNPGPLQVQRQSDKVRDYIESPLSVAEKQELEGPQYNFPLFAIGHQVTGTAPMVVGGGPTNEQQFMNNITAQLSAMASQSGVELTPAAAMAAASLMAACNQMNNHHHHQQQPPPPPPPGSHGHPHVVPPHPHPPLPHPHHHQQQQFQYPPQPHQFEQPPTNWATAAAYGGAGVINHHQPHPHQFPNPAVSSTFPTGFNSNSGMETGNSVVLVTNLNPEKSNPDALFTLFGVYGDVMRVKVMFNKKNTALVQFANHHQAITALRNLDSSFLWGKQMHLHISKTNVIQLPMEDANHGLTKDYSMSPLHRFKKPNSKNFQNIFPPNAVLHLSNIPPTITEGHLTNLIQNSGFMVKSFKFLSNDKKMALVELGSVEDAVHVLIQFHNYRLSEKNHLRISFSKTGVF